MRTLFFALFLTGMLFSCQKETSIQHTSDILPDSTGTFPTDTTAKLLTALVSGEAGTDGIRYEYDSASRLVREGTYIDTTRPLQRPPYSYTILYSYDGSGRLSTIKEMARTTRNNVVVNDTTYRFVQYENAISAKIAYIKHETFNNRMVSGDSVAYTYSNANITKTAHFRYAAGQPAPVQAEFYETWGYDAKGNMIKLEWYKLDTASGTYGFNFRYEFRYDDKINPQQFGEALLYRIWSATSPNNMVEQKNSYPDGRIEVLTTTYQYRTDGRPASATFDNKTAFYLYK